MIEYERRPVTAILREPLQAWLSRPPWHLGFPSPLEDHFEAETGDARRRWLFLAGMVAIAVFMVFSFTDREMLSDCVDFARAVRLYGFLPAALVLVVLMRLPLRPWLREFLDSLLLLVGQATLFAILATSKHLFAGLYVFGIDYAALFSLTIARLRFPYALGSTLVTFLGFFLALPHMASLPSPTHPFVFALVFTGLGLGLFANHVMERSNRTSYLHLLAERLRQESLTRDNASLSVLAGTDPLTGIANRRAFDRALQEFRSKGSPHAVAMFDVDHFKAYNDTYGHQAGDLCLQAVTKALSETLRTSDLLARLGGEEFALLLPLDDPERVCLVVQRLLGRVRSLSIPHQSSAAALHVTLSAGIAVCDGTTDCDDLLARSDAALYRAKAGGRDGWRLDGQRHEPHR